MERLEFLVEDSISKIKAAWKDTEGRMFASFSGGKDSMVLYTLIKMANIDCKFLFFDTGIELDAIYDHIKSMPDIEWLKPRKPFGRIIKEYGVPFRSKYLSEYLKTYDGSYENPFRLVRNNDLIKGTIHKIRENGRIEDTGQKIINGRALAKKFFHILHPDRVKEYKIANKCCAYLKKDPSAIYIKANPEIEGYFMGVRVAEGGVRATAYKSCRSVKKVGKRVIMQSMPMFDWEDSDVNQFVEHYKIPLSRAYTEYGLQRTGCFCCPFAREMDINLEALYKHEPKKYKAAIKWLGKVYMDMDVNLPFDENYTKEKIERDQINAVRKQEMLEKYPR